MGLDQYAYVKTAETDEQGATPRFYWRKHAKLQTFMEKLYWEKTGDCTENLNCGELELHAEDIDALETAVNTTGLPESEGGFFFGHQMQDEQAVSYQSQDLEFCAWARAEISQGSRVCYSCWW